MDTESQIYHKINVESNDVNNDENLSATLFPLLVTPMWLYTSQMN